MSDLQKYKRYDLIDMFNSTSRYPDDVFAIDNREENIFLIYIQ